MFPSHIAHLAPGYNKLALGKMLQHLPTKQLCRIKATAHVLAFMLSPICPEINSSKWIFKVRYLI